MTRLQNPIEKFLLSKSPFSGRSRISVGGANLVGRVQLSTHLHFKVKCQNKRIGTLEGAYAGGTPSLDPPISFSLTSYFLPITIYSD